MKSTVTIAQRVAIFFLLVLTLLPHANAQPPFNELQSGTLDIVSAHPQYILYESSNASLYFHVYNSTGSFLNNTVANCSMHIYNNTNGVHLEIDNGLTRFEVHDWYHQLNWTVHPVGIYSYFVNCYANAQTPAEAGYYRGEFIVNSSGTENTKDNLVIFIYILAILSIGSLLAYLVIILGKLASYSIGLYDMAANYSLYFLLLASQQLALEYVAIPWLLNWLDLFISILGWTAIVLPSLGYFVCLFIRLFSKKDSVNDYNERVM